MSSAAIDSLLMPPPPKRIKNLPNIDCIKVTPPQNVMTSKDKDDTLKTNENTVIKINEEATSFKLTTTQNQIQTQYQHQDCMEVFQSDVEKVDIEDHNHNKLPQYMHHETEVLNEEDELSTIGIDQEQSSEQKQHLVDFQTNKKTSAVVVQTRFDDIIGHSDAKLRLDEALLPLALPPSLALSILTGVRAAPASILLHGPPGCGKTKLAQAVAGEAQAAFISVGPSDVLSKFVGESEASIKNLFREAQSQALLMESKCTVLFFDEIDALGQSRASDGLDGNGGQNAGGGTDNSGRRVLAELLIQMSNLLTQSNTLHYNLSCADDEKINLQYSDQFNCSKEEYRENIEEAKNAKNRLVISGERSKEQCSGGETDQKEMMEQKKSDNTSANEKIPCDFDQHGTCTAQKQCYINTKPITRVIIVAATNRPEDCDPALLRRFAVRVHIGLPSIRDRRRIIRRFLKDIDNSLNSPQLRHIAEITNGYSGSDLESLAREAVMAPIRDCLRDAALLKAKVRRRKREKISEPKNNSAIKDAGIESVNSDYVPLVSEEEDCDGKARDLLLKKFSNLRPVSLEDFKRAISFWIGDQGNSHRMDFNSESLIAHQNNIDYDIGSSSEEDEGGSHNSDRI